MADKESDMHKMEVESTFSPESTSDRVDMGMILRCLEKTENKFETMSNEINKLNNTFVTIHEEFNNRFEKMETKF